MRVLVGSAAAVTSPQFVNLDEEAAPADEIPTVTVSGLVAGDLDDIVPEAVDGEVGLYRAVLPAATHTAALDRLTLTWSGEVDSEAVTRTQTVDVVDGHYASIPELRRHPDLASAERVPTDALRAYRDGFADLVERYRGASWVGRAARAVTTSGYCPPELPLFVRDILSVTIDDQAAVITGWQIDAAGYIYLPTPGVYGEGVSITYTYGLTDPIPEALRAACREYVRAAALEPDSGVPRNALSWGDGQGGTYRTSTANWEQGRPTGLMSVDRLLNEVPDHRVPTIA